MPAKYPPIAPSTWARTWEQEFSEGAGDLLIGPQSIRGVTYSAVQPARMDYCRFESSALRVTPAAGQGGCGVVFPVDSTQLGAAALTDRSRICVQWRLNNLPLVQQFQEHSLRFGPHGEELIAGLAYDAAASGLPGGLLGRFAAGAAAADKGAGSLSSATLFEAVIDVWSESIEFRIGVWAGTWPTPRTSTYYDTITSADREGGQAIPVARRWAGLLGALRALLIGSAFSAPATDYYYGGYSVWRSDQ